MEAHLPNRRMPHRITMGPRAGVAWAVLAAASLLPSGCTQHNSGEFSRLECGNGRDDDGDLLMDCDDPDCSAWVMCSPEFIRLRAFDAGEPGLGDPPDDSSADAQVPPDDADPTADMFALSAAEAMVPVSLGVGLCLDPCNQVPGLECYCLPDPYVQIALDGEVWWRSTTVPDALNPRWTPDSRPPAILALSTADMGRLTFIVKDDDDGELELGITPGADDLVFQCTPSLEDLDAGYLGCSYPEGDANSWVRVDAVRIDP